MNAVLNLYEVYITLYQRLSLAIIIDDVRFLILSLRFFYYDKKFDRVKLLYNFI